MAGDRKWDYLFILFLGLLRRGHLLAWDADRVIALPGVHMSVHIFITAHLALLCGRQSPYAYLDLAM